MRWLTGLGRTYLVLVAAGALLAGCSSGAGDGPTPPQSEALRLPLDTASVLQASGRRSPGAGGPEAWAIVEMGGNGSATTTWQLFEAAGPSRRWALATPAGVDTSGGLVASFVAGAGVVGVVPSSHLGFSPVATFDASGVPVGAGGLPGPLAPTPGALAGAPAGRLLALLGAAGATLVDSSDWAASTQTIARLPALAQEAGGSCELVSLTAVTYGPRQRPIAGGRCLASGRLGIFQLTPAGWGLVGPLVPREAVLGAVPSHTSGTGLAAEAAAEAVDTQVVRLWTNGSELEALALAVSPGGTTSLFRVTRMPSGSWRASSVFDVPPAEHLVATGTGSGAATFVLLSGSGDRRTALVLGSSAATWRELPAPPAGTATLALGADSAGATEALVVRQWKLAVYALRPGGTWVWIQGLTVPVP